MRKVAVLGATGSIGTSALDVIARHPQRFRASVLAAHRSVDALAELCLRFEPDLAVIADPALEAELARRLRQAGERRPGEKEKSEGQPHGTASMTTRYLPARPSYWASSTRRSRSRRH